MLARELLREGGERLRQALADRGVGAAPLDEWQRLDGERRALRGPRGEL